MKYIRSRPWRPRGPWFTNRAGARRRGRRDDELEFVSASEMTFEDGLLGESHDVAEDDVVLPIVATWQVPERLLAAAAEEDQVLALGPDPAAADQGPWRLDRVADSVIAAHMLSEQGDDSTTSRQSA